ncbi:P-II family nitrogen regulator [Kaistella sp.]|uniref:P-II family nitrogen regulator n=1 Tax=Kaistella sp. TaxID=2782235 RepID=UPI002F95E73A
MKIIHITAVQEFEKKVKDILLHSGVQAFSYGEVRGFKSNGSVSSSENWFASSGVETESLMFTVFADDEVLDKIAERIRKFNTQQEFESRIHLAAAAVEQII